MRTFRTPRPIFKIAALLFLMLGIHPFLAAEIKAQIRMMPLGNSITEGTGSSHDGGYRHDLFYLLQNAGINFNFVGSRQYGSGFADTDHEGHPGFLADQLAVTTYLTQNPADIVFLEIGTNDISSGETASEVYADIEKIIDDIYNQNHATAIYLSTVIPRKDSNALQATTAALNATLPGLVSAKAGAGYKIYFADNAARFLADPNWKTNLMADNLHPNDAGYTLMANEWFNVYLANSPPNGVLFADDFNSGVLDPNKWLRGSNAGNLSAVVGNVLELKSSGSVSGWVVTRQSYPARNTTAAMKVAQPNDDGNLGVSPTYNLASSNGIYGEANWYRFYTYRNGGSGPYRLYVAWKKSGAEDGIDVTGSLVINTAVYLRLRYDNTNIHFEASLDGGNWTDTYNEIFDLPGSTLDSPFYYELAAYKTSAKGTLVVDDFSIKALPGGTDTPPPLSAYPKTC